MKSISSSQGLTFQLLVKQPLLLGMGFFGFFLSDAKVGIKNKICNLSIHMIYMYSDIIAPKSFRYCVRTELPDVFGGCLTKFFGKMPKITISWCKMYKPGNSSRNFLAFSQKKLWNFFVKMLKILSQSYQICTLCTKKL